MRALSFAMAAVVVVAVAEAEAEIEADDENDSFMVSGAYKVVLGEELAFRSKNVEKNACRSSRPCCFSF